MAGHLFGGFLEFFKISIISKLFEITKGNCEIGKEKPRKKRIA